MTADVYFKTEENEEPDNSKPDNLFTNKSMIRYKKRNLRGSMDLDASSMIIEEANH